MSSTRRFGLHLSSARAIPTLFAVPSLLVALSVSFIITPVNAADIEPFELRKVALSGESPTVFPTDGEFHEFAANPVIDNHGDIAFIAALASPSAVSSVWRESNGELRLVAKSGSPAPTTGAAFSQLSDVVIADGGIIAFKATLAGATIDDDNQDSIWLDRYGALTLIAQAGHEAPDPTGDLRFSHFETPIAASQNGELAFFARTRNKEGGAAQSSGIWATGSSDVALAANDGMTAIDGQPDVVFLPQSFEQPFANDPVISPAGQTVFRGFLAGPGIDETNLNGLWSYRPSTGLESLLRAGDEAVDTNGERFLSFPGIPTINAMGDTAFLAFVGHHHDHSEEVSGVSPDGHELGLGLWLRRSSGEVSQIFMIGDHAPGIESEAHFIDTFNPVMNASSRVAFLAAVDGEGIDGTNEVGLWSNAMSPDGDLRLIARQGDEAPGREPGFVFGVFLEPSLNAAGQTAFMAAGYRQVDGTVLDSAFGVWGQDRAGRLRLVASVGQVLEIEPGDHREIASLMFASATGGEDGKVRGFNDAGQIVLRATFTDGSSGIFVSNALAVPEPSAAILVLFAAGCSWLRRGTD